MLAVRGHGGRDIPAEAVGPPVTRFDATTADDRRALVAEAVRAHRERESPFLTVELDPESVPDGPDGSSETGEEAEERAEPTPWIQFANDRFNLDCTDDELDRLSALLDSYPEFRIVERQSPDEAEGTNVRIHAPSDPERLAAFVDEAVQRMYGAPEDCRLWVVQV